MEILRFDDLLHAPPLNNQPNFNAILFCWRNILNFDDLSEINVKFLSHPCLHFCGLYSASRIQSLRYQRLRSVANKKKKSCSRCRFVKFSFFSGLKSHLHERFFECL